MKCRRGVSRLDARVEKRADLFKERQPYALYREPFEKHVF